MYFSLYVCLSDIVSLYAAVFYVANKLLHYILVPQPCQVWALRYHCFLSSGYLRIFEHYNNKWRADAAQTARCCGSLRVAAYMHPVTPLGSYNVSHLLSVTHE